MDRFKIIFLGEDSFSAVVLKSLIEAGFCVTMVVTPYYENNIYKRLELFADQHNIPFVREKNINSNKFISKIKSLNPSLLITAHFEKLLSNDLICIPTYGCINLHPSLLPYYRGMSPQHWPLINGDDKTGVTIHYINAEADKGDIILQRVVEIGPEMYVSDLQQEFIAVYKYIVVDAVEQIMKNEVLVTKQDHLQGSYYGRLKPFQCEIKSDMTKENAFNLIRGVSKPYYGAYYETFKIWKAKLLNLQSEESLMEQYPNQGIYFTDHGILLRLINGILEITKYEKYV